MSPTIQVSPEQIESRLQELVTGGWLAGTYADVTGRTAGDVEALLKAEAADPGSTVASELRRRGVEPFVDSPGLHAFYRESDAFLFELAVWNTRGFKRSMRGWTVARCNEGSARLGRPLGVLAYGDGVGLDAAALAMAGQDVTYFEVPGLSQQVAARLFEEVGVSVQVVTDPAALAGRAFDAVTCFDVLEHVPEPRGLVADLATKIVDGGLLFAHAPFYLVLPPYPTHLRANRRYAGRLNLYGREGLTLIDGRPLWNPLLFRKGEGGGGSAVRRGVVRAMAYPLRTGRYASGQFRLFHRLGRRG